MHILEYLRVKVSSMEEKMKKRAIGTIDNFVCGFTVKNMRICIYHTNLYFGGGKCQKTDIILEMVVRMVDSIRRIGKSYAI